MSNNKNFKVENGIQAAAYYENEGTVTTGEALSGVTQATSGGQSVGTFSPNVFAGMSFNDDGTKLYYVNITSDTIYEHTLSTAWDITSVSTTANHTRNTSTTDNLIDPRCIAFKTDGTVMYVAGNSAADGYGIYIYTLSTAWDLSTATYDSYGGVSTILNYALQFSDDGTKLYASVSSAIREYTLSTPWDLSTATLTYTKSMSRYGNAFAVSSDGTKIFYTYIYSSYRRLYQQDLSTPFSLASTTGSSYYNFAGTYFYSLFLKRNNGARLYTAENTIISQLDMGYETKTCDLSTGSYFDVDINGGVSVSFSNPPESGKVGTALIKVSGKPDVNPLSLATSGVYATRSIPAGGWGIYVTPDGKQLFFNYNTIYQYKMSVPWDVSTLYSDSLSVSFSALSTVVGNAIFFVDGGNRLWLFKNGTLQEFTLGNPYDIADAALNQTVTGLSGTQNSLYVGNNDTKMYTASAGTVYEYTLSTAGDPSTASLTNTYSTGYSTNYGVSLNSDGTKLYAQANDSTRYYVASYHLSIPWDVSTATLITATALPGGITSSGGNSIGFFMSPDERRVIHTSYDSNPLLYKIKHSDFYGSSTYEYDSRINFTNGVAPSLPNIASADYLLFNTTDGGATYSGKTILSGIY